MELTEEEIALLQSIIDGNAPPAQPSLDLRPQPGETREAYRARVAAARDQSLAQTSPGTQEMNAQAEAAMNLMPADSGKRSVS